MAVEGMNEDACHGFTTSIPSTRFFSGIIRKKVFNKHLASKKKLVLVPYAVHIFIKQHLASTTNRETCSRRSTLYSTSTLRQRRTAGSLFLTRSPNADHYFAAHQRTPTLS